MDIVINNAKNNKNIDINTANLLKECKSFLIEKFKNANKDIDLIGQEKVLIDINNKYINFEKAITDNNLEYINKIKDSIVKDYKKLMPTVELIKKVENLENEVMLLNNKKNQLVITELEKEILNKIA